MSPFAFLLIPVVVVAVASLYVYVRGRKPTGLHTGIDGFQREMNALSPDAAQRRSRRFDSGPSARPVRPTGPAGDRSTQGQGD